MVTGLDEYDLLTLTKKAKLERSYSLETCLPVALVWPNRALFVIFINAPLPCHAPRIPALVPFAYHCGSDRSGNTDTVTATSSFGCQVIRDIELLQTAGAREDAKLDNPVLSIISEEARVG